jgi:hypothetical protein
MDSNQNEISKYVGVQKKSPEFAKLEYMLQVSLGTSTAIIKNAWSVAKPQLNLQFEKIVSKKKMTVVNSFFDTSELDKSTSVHKIIANGFDIRPEGKVFSTGLFRLDKSGASSYRVLLCKVAVGKSLCYPMSNSFEDLKKEKLKDQFDSVYLKYEEDEASSVYRYEYVVYESSHVHPEYLIDFTFDDSRESNLRVSPSHPRSPTATNRAVLRWPRTTARTRMPTSVPYTTKGTTITSESSSRNTTWCPFRNGRGTLGSVNTTRTSI